MKSKLIHQKQTNGATSNDNVACFVVKAVEKHNNRSECVEQDWSYWESCTDLSFIKLLSIFKSVFIIKTI